MIYGYCRVSTKNQARLGTSLEDQKLQILRKYPSAEIIEESYTGTELSRPEFNRLIDKLNPNDTLVVCKIDRLARSITAGKVFSSPSQSLRETKLYLSDNNHRQKRQKQTIILGITID